MSVSDNNNNNNIDENNHKATKEPWVEKYRPSSFNDVILESRNRAILGSILATRRFPHLLFHGPPGVGKTTAMLNLVQAYLKGEEGGGARACENNYIQLNASDERGVDVIRTQILEFVSSRSLFQARAKFVILDEVDYMTRQAQQALARLIQTSADKPVRFCLICNYITRLDPVLSSEMVRVQFRQLPLESVRAFLQSVARSEGVAVDEDGGELEALMEVHRSDVRSMLNGLQSGSYASMLTARDFAKLLSLPSVEGARDLCRRKHVDEKTVGSGLLKFAMMKTLLKCDDARGGEGEGNVRAFMAFVANVVHNRDVFELAKGGGGELYLRYVMAGLSSA